MKKLILFFCGLSCLLNAQNSIPDILAENYIADAFPLNRSNQLFSVRASDVPNNLPDTIYTFKGEGKRMEKMETITYDESGRLLFVFEYFDNNANGTFDESDTKRKKDFNYGIVNDSVITEIISYEFDEGEWRPYIKDVFVQTEPDIRRDFYRYVYIIDEWYLLSEIIATAFTADGLPSAVRNSTYNPLNPYFSYIVHTEIIYDKNDRDSIVTSYLLAENGVLKDTLPIEKVTYHYALTGNLDKDIHFIYDEGDSSWIYDYSYEYSYDDKGNPASRTEVNEYGFKEVFYYAYIYPSTVSNTEIYPKHSTVYPNPVSDVLNISIGDASEADIVLFNSNGIVVLREKMQQPVISLPVNSLAKGYYLLVVQIGDRKETHKVIIR